MSLEERKYRRLSSGVTPECPAQMTGANGWSNGAAARRAPDRTKPPAHRRSIPDDAPEGPAGVVSVVASGTAVDALASTCGEGVHGSGISSSRIAARRSP